MQQLTQEELLLDENDLFFKWLKEGKVNFHAITEAYIYFLSKDKEKDKELINDLSYISSMYREPKLNCGTKEVLEERFAKAIVKSRTFSGTLFEKKLKKLIKSDKLKEKK